ncbi:hypothetical protein SBV1_1520023 [Verrucomicrobia bacterium]|nr:hypothetical protein SBV1_1520023 [Verrucomicrobiota bacterium]
MPLGECSMNPPLTPGTPPSGGSLLPSNLDQCLMLNETSSPGRRRLVPERILGASAGCQRCRYGAILAHEHNCCGRRRRD